jgi:thiol-disulfide isomerase/thioredoxin
MVLKTSSSLFLVLLPLAFSAGALACHGGPDAQAPSTPLVSSADVRPGTDGKDHALLTPGKKLTVIEFFSHHCPCQEAHDPKLRELAQIYEPKGVAFFGVDSEAGATVDGDQKEATTRAYPYPLLIDKGGKLAKSVGARFATYTVVLDASGHVLYGGGIDSDNSHLTPDATPYLKNALDEALAGTAVKAPRTQAFGCSLTLE